jgi:hypothetical protein
MSSLEEIAGAAFRDGEEAGIAGIASAAAKAIENNTVELAADTSRIGTKAVGSEAASEAASNTLSKVINDSKGSGDSFLNDLISKGENASAAVPPQNALNDLAESISSKLKSQGKDATSAWEKARAAMSIKNLILTAGVGYGAYMVIDPIVAYNEKNNQKLTITMLMDVSQTAGSKPGDIEISYTPSVALYDGSLASNPSSDNLSISGTNCTPNINGGSYPVTRIISPTSCIININTQYTTLVTPQSPLQVITQGGVAILQTTVANQTSLASIGSGKYLGSLAGGVANTAGDAIKSFLNGVGQFLAPFWKYIQIALIIIASIIVLGIVLKILNLFKKNSGFGRRRRRY